MKAVTGYYGEPPGSHQDFQTARLSADAPPGKRRQPLYSRSKEPTKAKQAPQRQLAMISVAKNNSRPLCPGREGRQLRLLGLVLLLNRRHNRAVTGRHPTFDWTKSLTWTTQKGRPDRSMTITSQGRALGISSTTARDDRRFLRNRKVVPVPTNVYWRKHFDAAGPGTLPQFILKGIPHAKPSAQELPRLTCDYGDPS